MPAKLIETHYMNKLGIDKSKSFPTTGWIYMGMEQGLDSRMV